MNWSDKSSSTSAIPPWDVAGFRRQYNAWVADETMEDYALRYAPRSFRKWSEWRIANTALGSLSFLIMEAIGAVIVVNYGFTNAMWAILVVGLIVFLTGIPIAWHAARYGLDIDLLTRGAGFGYLGSTITSITYVIFTFIFFALEAAIMAMALQMLKGWPLPVCYALSSLIILPLVIRGVTFISRLQTWTQPLCLFLLILPFVWFALSRPWLFRDFVEFTGSHPGGGFHPAMFGAAAAVVFPLIVQIAEQVDYLRFMPPPKPGKQWRWWAALLSAGPGWIVPGMLKMAGGAFLAYVAMQYATPQQQAMEPAHMFLVAFKEIFGESGVAVAVTILFVMISQIKINVTNAYAGSLAWSNFFVRLARSHPGRVVWLTFNIFIATLLMALGIFDAFERVLGFYGVIATAWIGALVADLVINKPLGLSPPGIEFRRGYLYDFNIGLCAMLLAIFVGSLLHSGALGETAKAFTSFIVLGMALVFSPLLAWATQGRYYLARRPETLWRPGETIRCSACGHVFEAEDMVYCPILKAPVCSLCCALETDCHDRCKGEANAAEQLHSLWNVILPCAKAIRFNSRIVLYLAALLALCATGAFLLTMAYFYGEPEILSSQLLTSLFNFFILLALPAIICGGYMLKTDNRQRAARGQEQAESQRHVLSLLQEIAPPPALRATAYTAAPGKKTWRESAALPDTLPDTLRETLLRLARRGEASALRQRLQEACAEHPDHLVFLAQLQAFVDRLDFQTLIRSLVPEEND
jgi:purine-cytosine permease-like protein